MKALGPLALGAVAAMLLLRRDRPEPHKPSAPRATWDWTPDDLEHLSQVDRRLVDVFDRARQMSPSRFAITDGLRSEQEQQSAVSRGTTRCDPEKGCISHHLTGHAVDAAPLDARGKPEQWDRSRFVPLAATIKAAARELGIAVKWGGDWPEPQTDVFHWQVSR